MLTSDLNKGSLPPKIPLANTGQPPRRNKFQIGEVVKMKGWEGIRLLVVDFDIDKGKTTVSWNLNGAVRERRVLTSCLWKAES